jgi:hypothetical protein
VSGAQETVDVRVDTTSEIQTLSSSNNAVIGSKAVSEIPLNGRSFTQLLQLTPGLNASGSLNGSRSNQLNYQIDGADNNDPWSNQVASNQGGIAGIAGGLIPVEAIDQFSLQAAGEADQGVTAERTATWCYAPVPTTFTATSSTSIGTNSSRGSARP